MLCVSLWYTPLCTAATQFRMQQNASGQPGLPLKSSDSVNDPAATTVSSGGPGIKTVDSVSLFDC